MITIHCSTFFSVSNYFPSHATVSTIIVFRTVGCFAHNVKKLSALQRYFDPCCNPVVTRKLFVPCCIGKHDSKIILKVCRKISKFPLTFIWLI